MSGLLRRLTSRRPPTAGGDGDHPAAPAGTAGAPGEPRPAGAAVLDAPGESRPAETGAEPRPARSGHAAGTGATAAGATADASPAAGAHLALPAGLDPEELAARPDPTARRSRLRRRLRFLRAAREVLLRDLGGFVLELHRTAGGHEQADHRRLREAKLARLLAVEEEARAIEARLGEATHTVVIREPGLGGECPRCSELLASDARFCSHCGLAIGAAPATVATPDRTTGGAGSPENTGSERDRGAVAKSAERSARSAAEDPSAGEGPADQPTSPTRPVVPGDAPTETVPAVADPYAAPAERRG
jgi:hypothetical protein